MKKVILAVALAVVCAHALEMKIIPAKIVPQGTEGMVYKNGQWVYVPVVEGK